MCRGNSFFFNYQGEKYTFKKWRRQSSPPKTIHKRKQESIFIGFFHHEAYIIKKAYNADRPNNEIHESWCWTKTGWPPLMASILFLGCRIYGCLGFFCGVVSISTLALMSFSRYIHVCKSSKCKGFFLIFGSEFVSRILVVVVNFTFFTRKCYSWY